MMTLSGVRSSWDMVETNSDLNWFARRSSATSRRADGKRRLVGDPARQQAVARVEAHVGPAYEAQHADHLLAVAHDLVEDVPHIVLGEEGEKRALGVVLGQDHRSPAD